jgi:hypothetical protein
LSSRDFLCFRVLAQGASTPAIMTPPPTDDFVRLCLYGEKQTGRLRYKGTKTPLAAREEAAGKRALGHAMRADESLRTDSGL